MPGTRTVEPWETGNLSCPDRRNRRDSENLRTPPNPRTEEEKGDRGTRPSKSARVAPKPIAPSVVYRPISSSTHPSAP